MSRERDRIRHPSSSTPARQPDSDTGQPLHRGVREKMENGFGHNFSAVRVHADGESAASARAMGAQAFTIGNDVHFGPVRYQPQSQEGQELLAHELAHVVQQSRGGASAEPEQRADVAAARVLQGETVPSGVVGGAPRAIQMKPDAPAKAPTAAQPITDPDVWSNTLDRFALNSPALNSAHRKAIDALAAEIAARVAPAGTKAVIAITGHTDTSGDEKHNETLGLKRAETAKAALESALKKRKVSADRVPTITADSAGETRLAKGTADNVREPLNRRVEISVRIEGPPVVSIPPQTPTPEAEPKERKKPIDLNLPRDYKLPEESWWDRTERERKAIEEFDRAHPRKSRSLTDYLVEGALKLAEPVIKRLPMSWRAKARDAVRKGIESGTEKGCEAAIDAIGVGGEEAEGLKAACKAALKTKPGASK